MDDLQHQESVLAEIRARQSAAKVLGITEDASKAEIRSAWHRRCLATHPDHNPDDPRAEEKFRIINCAYRFLSEGEHCAELAGGGEGVPRPPRHGKYDLSNTWGLFLWWRETFF